VAAALHAADALPTVSILILTRHRPQRLERCLAALARLPDPVSREILILLNDADDDVRAMLEAQAMPVRILESPVNLGFAGGCNMTAAAATGRYLAFLNDDTEVEPGWLQSLVEIADSDPSVGAVGSCILFPDGSIQESGSIIWRDGSTMGLGRGESPGSPGVSFVRRVDYCSACSLLVRREAWNAVGGFCEDYFPAYYEDVDLCLSIRALGYRVLYTPRSRVRHDEGGSSDPGFRLFLHRYQRRRFRQRWGHLLQEFEPPNPSSSAAVRRAEFRARGCPRRLLLVDDRLPDRTIGSGFGRMRDAVVELSEAGYAVSIWPTGGLNETLHELGMRGIETISGGLEAHLREPSILYDIVIISRPHNFERYQALVRECQPHSVLVYDAEAVYHRRIEYHAKLMSGAAQAAVADHALTMRALETSLRGRADFVTCVSPPEQAFFRSTEGAAPIALVPLSLRHVRFSERRYEDRHGIAFVAGWLGGSDSPNGDSLIWFMSDVMPLVVRHLPACRLTVTGDCPPELRERFRQWAVFPGRVLDLARLYEDTRVAVVPTRYGAGVKTKTVEALQYGVPVVATTVGAEGIAAPDLDALMIADDPVRFAECVVSLHTEKSRWTAARGAIRTFVTASSMGSAGAWVDALGRAQLRRSSTAPD
jgi:GT2 family glycosyltransferase/glycosyltransferase involved in cell wall biosynthesis